MSGTVGLVGICHYVSFIFRAFKQVFVKERKMLTVYVTSTLMGKSLSSDKKGISKTPILLPACGTWRQPYQSHQLPYSPDVALECCKPICDSYRRRCLVMTRGYCATCCIPKPCCVERDFPWILAAQLWWPNQSLQRVVQLIREFCNQQLATDFWSV